MEIVWGKQQVERPPERLCPEHGYLILAAVSLAAVAATTLVDRAASVEIGKGWYDALAVTTVVGLCGWLVRSTETRVERRLDAREQQTDDRVAELTTTVATLAEHVQVLSRQVQQLADQVSQARVTYLPPPRREAGQRYIGAIAVGEATSRAGEATPRVGLDPEAIAAARTIAQQLLKIDGERGTAGG